MMRCVYMFLASSITVFYYFFFRPDDEAKSSKYIVNINITLLNLPCWIDIYKTRCFYYILPLLFFDQHYRNSSINVPKPDNLVFLFGIIPTSQHKKKQDLVPNLRIRKSI